jgi:hypothetical protein
LIDDFFSAIPQNDGGSIVPRCGPQIFDYLHISTGGNCHQLIGQRRIQPAPLRSWNSYPYSKGDPSFQGPPLFMSPGTGLE